MSRGESGRAGAVSLDDLIALNDEMAALVRAGVPLEQGLIELGQDMPGKMGDLATRLGERIKAGEALPQILASDQDRFPPVWRAVVEAGLRSGRLSAALEGLSTTSRRVAELRRVVGMSLVYPLVVLSVAYGLFLFSVTHLTPRMSNALGDLASSSDVLLNAMVWLGQTAIWWAIWPPVVVAVLIVLWWYRSGRAAWSQRAVLLRGKPGNRRRWPSIRQSLHDGRMATFTEMLALLVEQQVPLHDAVVLAADASGDRGLGEAARSVADRLRHGETLFATDALPRPFPRFLAWLLASGAQQPQLHQTLLLTADTYRQRATQAATWNAVYLPIILTAVIGGTATLIQGLVVFVPICRLLYGLALSPHGYIPI